MSSEGDVSSYVSAALRDATRTVHSWSANVRHICPDTGAVIRIEKYDFSGSHVKKKTREQFEAAWRRKRALDAMVDCRTDSSVAVLDRTEAEFTKLL